MSVSGPSRVGGALARRFGGYVVRFYASCSCTCNCGYSLPLGGSGRSGAVSGPLELVIGREPLFCVRDWVRPSFARMSGRQTCRDVL